MLDWLKTILGEQYTEDIDKKVSSEIGKAFVSKTDFDAKNEAYKGLQGQIADRDKQLDDLKKVDAAALQAEITRLQGENQTAKETHEKQLSELQFDHALDGALSAAKARDAVSVKANLNRDALKFSDGKIVGLDEQLTALKTSKDYLFESDTPAPQIIGSTTGAPAADMSTANLRSVMGLPAKQE